MSTGAECNFWEEEPGRWKYRLQHYPYGETDDYDTFGPFAGFERAYKHLHDNHANPGGFSVRVHETDHRHEWAQTNDQEIDGFTVEINVTSLGGEATRDDVIRHIQSLELDHPAFRIRPHYGWVENVTRCASCRAKPTAKEQVNAR